MTDTQLFTSIVGPDKIRELQDAGLAGKKIYIPLRILPEGRNENILIIFSESLSNGSTCENAYATAAEASGLSVRQVKRVVAAG